MWNFIKRLWKRWLLPISNNATAAGLIVMVVSIYVVASGKAERLTTWLGETVIIWRWQLPAQFTFGLLVAGAIIWLRHRQQRVQPKPAFQPMVVCDPNYPIEWRIQMEPRQWLNDTRVSTRSPGEHQRILSGPYHVACKAELKM